MSFRIALSAPKKGKGPKSNTASAPFGGDDEEDDVVGSSLSFKKTARVSQYGDISAQKRYQANVTKALEVDATIYDYDAAWEAMAKEDEKKAAAEKEQAAEGKSKYMENLLAAREVRERDMQRAKESKYQREREAEGDEYADKEKFVTAAYKKHQEETKLMDIVEKSKEEAELKKRQTNGKVVFLNRLLQQEGEKHREAVEAVESVQASGAANPAAEPAVRKKTDVEIAKELNAQGVAIELTDDGEVTDRRELLTAGLNFMGGPKLASKRAPNQNATINVSRSVSKSQAPATYTSREKQSRALEDQLLKSLLKRQAEGIIDTDLNEEKDFEEKRPPKIQKVHQNEGRHQTQTGSSSS